MNLKILFLLVILLAFTTASYADEVELKIRSVGLDSTLATVKAKLGKPVSEKKKKAEGNCYTNGELFLTLKYSGLEVKLLSDKDGKNFKVITMTLTSAKWKYANGITIGATQKQILKKFGNPEYVFTTPPNQTYNYIHKGESSSANFIFRDGKLVKVEWEIYYC